MGKTLKNNWFPLLSQTDFRFMIYIPKTWQKMNPTALSDFLNNPEKKFLIFQIIGVFGQSRQKWTSDLNFSGQNELINM